MAENISFSELHLLKHTRKRRIVEEIETSSISPILIDRLHISEDVFIQEADDIPIVHTSGR